MVKFNYFTTYVFISRCIQLFHGSCLQCHNEIIQTVNLTRHTDLVIIFEMWPFSKDANELYAELVKEAGSVVL